MLWAWLLRSLYALGPRNYALGMDALVTVCSWNTNGIMLWAWMLWAPHALGTRTKFCFGHRCSGHRMLLEHNGILLWAWMLWSPYALGTRTELCFGHGCSGHRMLLEHERNYALGMDALVTVCSWNMNGIMLWAWMLSSSRHRMLFNTNGKPTNVSLKKRAFRWTEKSPDG